MHDNQALHAALDSITAHLQKVDGQVSAIRALFGADSQDELTPSDPANKYEIGGLEKLTPRGIEVCYRLFDRGLTRYAVAQMMNISFGAATHRHGAWQKAGGVNRQKQPL